MSLTKIDVAAAGVYYLEAGEVHGDIVSPVHGDLAIYTYAPAGGFLGQEYSFATSTGWFKRTQISEGADGDASIPTVLASRPATPGTAAEMAADAAAIIAAGTEVADQGKRWENTTDGLVYIFGAVNGIWNYYLEGSTDEFGAITVSSAKTRDIIDVNADGNTYYGSAKWGSAEADAAWTIERKNAAGTEFVQSAPNQVWDDRATTVVYNSGVA